MLKRLFQNSNKITSLGRWQTSDQGAEIRAVLANYDSCGDNLCGDPSLIKKALDEAQKNIILDNELIKDKKKK